MLLWSIFKWSHSASLIFIFLREDKYTGTKTFTGVIVVPETRSRIDFTSTVTNSATKTKRMPPNYQNTSGLYATKTSMVDYRQGPSISKLLKKMWTLPVREIQHHLPKIPFTKQTQQTSFKLPPRKQVPPAQLQRGTSGTTERLISAEGTIYDWAILLITVSHLMIAPNVKHCVMTIEKF